MKKIAYEVLAPQVEALYSVKFRDDQLKEIEDHCMKIQAMIEASGWDLDEYLQRWLFGESN